MPTLGTLLIRADAGPVIGVGHVMRCLGLAQAWQDRGGRVAFATAAMPPVLASRLASEGMAVHAIAAEPASGEDAHRTKALAKDADWLLVDGYNFTTQWLRQVRGNTPVAIWTDHAHADDLPVNLVLNQNPHAESTLYRLSAPGARLLLGPDFIVLRREFIEPLARRSARSYVRRLLVTFGGGIAAGAHDAFLDAAELLGARLPQTTLLVGHDHPSCDAIFARAARYPAVKAQIATDGFSALVEDSDLAVSAAGATLWELAALGVPSLALVIAENQEPLAQHLQSRGAGVSLGWLSSATGGLIATQLDRLLERTDAFAAMSRAALALVDGHGAQRVCDALTTSA